MRELVVVVACLVGCGAGSEPARASGTEPAPAAAATPEPAKAEAVRAEPTTPPSKVLGALGDDKVALNDPGASSDPCEGGELTGGLGLSGAGAGGGGGGEGKIGSIGHAGGTGAGAGVGRGRLGNNTIKAPTVTAGKSTVTGSLDKEIIRRVVRRNTGRLTYCYEKQLANKPGIAGTVTVKFTINPKGDVLIATATGFDADVSTCVETAFKSMQFPEPGGGIVEVSYPLVFKPE